MNGTHNPWLVAVSVALAVFASYTALDLAGSLTSVRGRARLAWLTGGGIAMGMGIWSMHFIGMLAFSMPGMEIAYDARLLALSILVAVAASASALVTVARANGTPAVAGAALALGAAISGMHYIGIGAMRVPALIVWSPPLVGASVAVALTASFAALWLAFRWRGANGASTLGQRACGAMGLGVAISGMHYTAMAAARFVPLAQPVTPRPGDVLVTAGLPAAVTGATLLLLFLAVVGSAVSRQVASRTAAILESISDAFFALDGDWRFTYINAEAERLLGRPRRQLLGRSIWDEFADAVGSVFEREYRRAVTERRTVQFEAFYPPLNAWFEVRAYPSAHGLSVYFHDVSERRRAQAELMAAEAHYRRLVETSPDAIFALDAAGRFRELNPAAGLLLGRATEELIGQPMADRLEHLGSHSDNSSRHRGGTGQTEVLDEELCVVRPSGEKRRVHVRSTVIREAGEVVGRHGIMRDITEERARDAQMRLLSYALDELDRAVTITDQESDETLYRNVAWANLLGCDPEKRYEPRTADLLPDDAAREQLAAIQQGLAATGRWSGRIFRRRIDDGRVVPLDVVIGTSGGGDGRRLTLAVLQDASERIEQERRLRRAERLASLGTLVGGVAHELNNPLHAILNFAHLLLEDPRPPEEREDLETIRWEAQRMARIVANLRRLARQTEAGEGSRGEVDLNGVVRRVLEIRRYSLETHGIRVREDLDIQLPPVWANRGEMEQVILNLVVNAEQALAESGRADRLLSIRTESRPSGAAVHVVDNGPGIPYGDLEQIFDPFFTTKSPGQGVGLGLSLVHGMVEEHGGEIRVESEAGQGVAFRIDLPRAPAAPSGPPPAMRPSAEPRTLAPLPLRILLVDDEPTLRFSLARFLTRRGHEVEEAADGHEALRLLERPDAGYHAILSDLRMPGLGGEELLRHLGQREGDWASRMIFLTGDAASGRADDLQRTAGVPVLLKPIDLRDVAELIERRAGAAAVDEQEQRSAPPGKRLEPVL